MDRHIARTLLILMAAGSQVNAGDFIVPADQSFFARSSNDSGSSIISARRINDGDSGLIPAHVVSADATLNAVLEPANSEFGLAAYEPPMADKPLLWNVAPLAVPDESSTFSRFGRKTTALTRPQVVGSFVEERFMRLVGWEDGDGDSSDIVAGCNCGRIMDCSCGSGEATPISNCQCSQSYFSNGCSCSGCCNGCGCNNGLLGGGLCSRLLGGGIVSDIVDGGFLGGMLDGCLGGQNCNCEVTTCDSGCDVCCHEFGGWLAWGSYWNSHGIDTSFGNAPLGFNNITGPQLNQAWLYLTREAQTGGGLDWGYRIDGLWGADGPDTTSFGDGSWDSGWTTSGQYGFAIPQLYGEIAYNKMRVKLGHFYTIIGYEVVQAPDNFFYSRPYTMYYNEPFTHSGILMERSVGDTVTTYCGWTAGWDTGFSNGNNGSVYLGGLSWTPSDKVTTTYEMTMGDPGDDPGQRHR